MIPKVKKLRGYYATEFVVVNLGKIKVIKPGVPSEKGGYYVAYFYQKPPVQIKSTKRFIRWLGL
ncbi:hypothetical protein DF186_14955 [Enterococcus hirae]|nr:hypothetical protein DF186_14955 [Enterococcus hirae]